jgi:hypothetical protein
LYPADKNNDQSQEERVMKHFPKNKLSGFLALFVMTGLAGLFYFGQYGPGAVNAGQERIKVASNAPAEESEDLEISALLKKMNLSIAADQPIMPDFELLDLEGKKVRISEFQGETVLLGFFTTW